MRAVLVALVGLFGCLQNGLVPCDDGRLCPAGTLCGVNTCYTLPQLEACGGLGEGEVCDLRGAKGICANDICVFANCGNGLIEPPEVCDDGNVTSGDGCSGTCLSTEICGNGVLELAEQCDCGTPDTPGPDSCNGTSNGGEICNDTCAFRRCGDGNLDPGEVCDDGDTLPGGDGVNLFTPGCSIDCRSTEVCGNGITDFFVREQCDDSNTRNLDGCSMSCKPEQRAWHELTVLALPSSVPLPPREDFAMAYDSARDRIVVFGGEPPDGYTMLYSDTWELVGSSWIHRQIPGITPQGRRLAGLVYVPTRQRLVMFGGASSFGRLDDTWEYDGARWYRIDVPVHPSARSGYGLAYDAARDRVVLFGGFVEGEGMAADTWEYDGTAWVEMTPAASPPPRQASAMVYDPIRNRIVLYGGQDYGGTLDDTWEYDGTTWTARAVDARPPPDRAAIVFDPARGHPLIYGGLTPGTWELVDLGWRELVPTTPITNPYRYGHRMAYDTRRMRTLLIAGSDWMNGGPYSDTWAFDGTTWTERIPPEPGQVALGALVYDTAQGGIVLAGGTDLTANVWDRTWTLDGSAWTPSAPMPAPRTRMASSHDALGQRTLVFGGVDGSFSTMYNTLFAWSQGTWEVLTTTTPPSPRVDAVMASDNAGNTILHGGYDTQALVDTWKLVGTQWTQLTTTNSPPPRRGTAMVYDAKHDRFVVFGGQYESTLLGDTWALTGTTWTQLPAGSPGPMARTGHAMAYDPLRGRVILFGGETSVDFGNDTWELDGDTWERVLLEEAPYPRVGHQMAWDAANARIVVYGGIIPVGAALPDLWELGFSPESRPEVCRSGVDTDGDGKAGCIDEDCWYACAPVCPPTTPSTCTSPVGCGDGVCAAVETCRSCPADCAIGTTACPVVCGDNWCDSPETAITCPGDC